jgi:hypothetical protein
MGDYRSTWGANPHVRARSTAAFLLVASAAFFVAALLAHGTLAWVEAGVGAVLLVLLLGGYAVRRRSRDELLYGWLRRRGSPR